MKRSQPTLGSRLRALRTRNRWTQRQMSERTRIPLSTLVKVEQGRLTLTYEKLLQVSERLGISVREWFLDSDNSGGAEPEVTGRRSLGLLADARHVSTRNFDHYYMCPELRIKRMIPVITRIRGRNIEDEGGRQRHAGEKYITYSPAAFRFAWSTTLQWCSGPANRCT